MITFGSLFAGQVDQDSIGFDGTPVNDRRHSGGQPAAELLDHAVAAVV